MKESYQVLYQGGNGEIEEKKSRFIASILPIETEEEALQFIEQTKKKFWDASHHCTAYVLGQNNEIERCNDNGEPSGTAGKPMLDILLKEEIHNAAVVVTRYFGGTLLGTGGLVRAYQRAVKEALKNCTVITKIFAKEFQIITDYNSIGKLQYIAGQLNLPILKTDYTDIVMINLLVTPEQEQTFRDKINHLFSGKAEYSILKEVYFAELSGTYLIFIPTSFPL